MGYPIERRHKYELDKEWSHPATIKWINETAKNLKEKGDQCREDYQEYKQTDFQRLEEKILSYIGEITEDRAKLAVKLNNMLRAFVPSDRKRAQKLRATMEKEGAGVGKPVNIQVVFVLLREEEYLNKEGTQTASIPVFRIKKICKEEGDSECCFIDTQCRVYETWNHYLDTNKLPRGILCYPKGGFVLKQSEDGNNNNRQSNDICFAEPPSCKLLERAIAVLDKVVTVATPVVALTLFWTPAGWAATALSAASYSFMGYQALRQGYSIYDKSTHNESYGADLFQIVSTIVTMALSKGIPRYLRGVVAEQRALTFLESFVINSALWGMTGSQIINIITMGYRIVTKDKLTWLDVLNFAVAAQNLYSCCMSPKTANSFLRKIKNEMTAERLRETEMKKKAYGEKSFKANEDLKKLEDQLVNQRRDGASPEEINTTESKIVEQREAVKNLQEGVMEDYQKQINKYQEDLNLCKKRITEAEAAGNQQRVEELRKDQAHFEEQIQQNTGSRQLVNIGYNQLQLDGYEKALQSCNEKIEAAQRAGDETRVAELRQEEALIRERIQAFKESTQQSQQKFLDDKGTSMKDEQAKGEYKKFVDLEQSEERRGDNTVIDQNNRIIRAVISMDAERVFKLIAETNSTVRFANGEDIVLHFNDEIRIHPSAVDQLHLKPDAQGMTDLKKLLQMTKDHKAERLNETNEARELREENYRKDVRALLKPYRMITDTEIKKFMDNHALTELTVEERRYFNDLKPGEVHRLRNVMEESNNVDGKWLKAAVKLAESRGVANNPREIANCIEIIQQHANEQVNEELRLADECRKEYDNDPTRQAANVERAQICRDATEAKKQQLDVLETERKQHMERARVNGENLQAVKEHYNARKAAIKQETERIYEENKPDRLPPVNENDVRNKNYDALTAENSIQLRNLNTRIDEKIEIIKGYPEGTKEFGTDLAAYYHMEKHGRLTFDAYYRMRGKAPPANPTPEEIYKIYHQEMAKKIITKNNFTGDRVAQYGQTQSHEYEKKYSYIHPGGERRQGVYFGVTVSNRVSIPYNWDYQLENWSHATKFATHYEKS